MSPGAAPPPGTRPGAHQGVLRVRAGTDRDDATASAPVAVAFDDRGVPDVPRHGTRVPSRGGGAAHGALAQAGRCRAQGATAGGAAAPRWGPVPRGAGAYLPATA